MSRIGFYSRLLTRDYRDNLRRILDVHSRYGVDGLKMIHRITQLLDLLEQFNVFPTFPIPVVVLIKYPQFFTHLLEKGIELAVHGYRHVDYTKLSLDQVEQELGKAYASFRAFGLAQCGFRFPFLRKHSSLLKKLSENGYAWDSSVARYWKEVFGDELTEKKKKACQRILSTYQAIPAEEVKNLPYWIGQMIEIPVSLPDDDMVLDRIGNKTPQFLFNVWLQILENVRNRREVFVLQAHPERYDFFYIALSQLIYQANTYGDVWITNLGEIANWWKERSNVDFQFISIEKDQWKVIPLNSNRLTLYCFSSGKISEIPVYSKEKTMYWQIQSVKRPWLGVHPETPSSVFQWLKQEGILYEVSSERSKYNLYLHEPNLHIPQLSKKIFTSHFCIFKLGEWPKPFRCALAITGDIDSMDVWGFWSKLYAR